MLGTPRRRSTKPKPDIDRFQVAQLRHLLRHRGQNQLPDDERSRRYLQALLDLGLTGPEAWRMAPWIANDELRDMIAMCVVSRGWNARSLGDLFELTLQEKIDLGLKNLDAFDAPRWQYQEHLAKRRRQRDAVRGRRRRARAREENRTMTQTADAIIMRPAPPGTPWNMLDLIETSHERQRLLYGWMTGKGWLAIPDMARGTLRRDIPAYDRRDVHIVERTLHRDADELVKLGLLVERKVAMPNGVLRREVRQAVESEEAVNEDGASDTRTR